MPLEECLNLGCVVLKHQLFGGLTMMCQADSHQGKCAVHLKTQDWRAISFVKPTDVTSEEGMGFCQQKPAGRKGKHQAFEDDIPIGGGFKDIWFSALPGEMMQFG